MATSKVKDWISRLRRSVKGIEKHHLFPKDYLETKLGIKDVRRTNQVANFALVEWSDNIDISNKPPGVYWPEQIADKKLEGKRLTRQEGWHALLPSFEELVVSGVILAGTALTAADPDISVDAEVLDDGYVKVGDHTYEDLDRAAHAAGADVSSGWTFWEVQLADGSGAQSSANIRSQVRRGWTVARAAPSA